MTYIIFLDAAMCFLWILTYTLVLIGTIRYKYPLIPLATQAIIAPFEFAVFIRFIISSRLHIDYIFLAYFYWTVIEIAIIYVILKSEKFRPSRCFPYILLIGAITCIMCYLVLIKGWIFFFSYFNTFVGEIIWFCYILRKDYPMKPLALASFIAKFIGDAVSVPVYFDCGIWFLSLISVLLPVLDFIFIVVYINRKRKESNRSDNSLFQQS